MVSIGFLTRGALNFAHSSMEYLGSDIKIIKELLSRIEKFILDKSIDGSKANDIKDFKGLDKVAWRFISALYSSQWNSLLVDGTNHSFRNNVKSKFSPQVVKEATKAKESNISHFSYVSTLPLPILVKSAKKVNEISRYFKKNNNLLIKNPNHMYRYPPGKLIPLILLGKH